MNSKPFVSVVCDLTQQQAHSLPYLVSLYCCQDYPVQQRELVILDTSEENQLSVIESLTDGQQITLNIRYFHESGTLNEAERHNKLKALASSHLTLSLSGDVSYPQNFISAAVAKIRQETSTPQSSVNGQYTIGFYMETAFHYQVYRPVLRHLLVNGYACCLVISDFVPQALIVEMEKLLGEIDDPRLQACAYSTAQSIPQPFRCLVSPYYTPALNNLAPVHVRALYGLAKEQWNHAWWNAFYHRILCYSHYSQQALNINGNAEMVGNPRFDDWHNPPEECNELEELKLDPKKPTLLYAPTFGALSSIPHWAKWLERLSRDYNVITKLHHGTLCRP